jgi:hypothetical protein
MKKLHTIFIIIASLVVVSCQPSATAIPTTTPIPFSEFNLENLLIQENDLPAGYSGAQVSNMAISNLPEKISDIPEPDYSISQEFEKDGKQGGTVSIFLYEDLAKLNRAFSTMTPLDTEYSVEGDWEEGELLRVDVSYPITLKLLSFTFYKCHAIVRIHFLDSVSEKNSITYGNRLIKRLTPLVCR